MNRKYKIILFAAGIGIFIYLLLDYGLSNVLINLHKTGWYFVPIVSVWFFVYLLNAVAFHFVLADRNSKIPFLKLFSLTISGFAINYITPVVGLGGEPYRIAELKEQIGTSKAVSATILYTMVHFLSSFVFWILIIFLALTFLSITYTTKISLIVALVVFAIIVYLFISLHKTGLVGTLLNIILKIPFINKLAMPLAKKENSIQKIDKQITDLYLKRKSDFLFALLFEVIARIISSFEYLFILHAIGIEITFLEALYINAVSAFVINLFFFMPLELGSREGGLILVLETLKMTSSIGIYIGLASRLRELFWILLGLVLIGLSGKKINKKLITEVGYEKNTVI